MNLPLVTSYIIAGLLFFSIAMLNIRVQNSSAELVITQIVRDNLNNITDMLNDDLPNAGYDVIRSTRHNDAVDNKVLAEARPRKISFYRNISNDPTKVPDLVTWELLDENPGHGNPNHKILVRSVQYESTGTPDVTEIRSGVTRFDLRYYDTVGDDLENNIAAPGQLKNQLDRVKQIHLILEVQSREMIYNQARGSGGRYITTVWEKRFTPVNLQIE